MQEERHPALKLYVNGQAGSAHSTITHVLRINDDLFNGRCQIRIIDVHQNPELAEEDGILATPTLIREWPSPARRIVGDMTGDDQIVVRLLREESYP